MFFMHPVCLGISLVSALIYAVYLGGRRAVRFQLCGLLPMLLLAAVVNPAFNHEGATLLTYLPSGNPLTPGEHGIRPCGGGHAVRGDRVVFLLYGGDDVG